MSGAEASVKTVDSCSAVLDLQRRAPTGAMKIDVPQSGAIEVDGVALRDLDLASWRSRVTAVFQDFVRFELPLRDNVAPSGAPDAAIVSALEGAGAAGLASLDTVLARGYEGGMELSGGQWQRVALARALCAVQLGAGVVLLDEPTAQLDVRGEAEIFARLLAATRRCTTVLISHRFSTVRQADRICVLEHGRVVLDCPPPRGDGLDPCGLGRLAYPRHHEGGPMRGRETKERLGRLVPRVEGEVERPPVDRQKRRTAEEGVCREGVCGPKVDVAP